MTDSEKEKDNNLRLALEELNSWLRHTETFFWALSSALLGGTGFAIYWGVGMNGKDWRIIPLGITIIVLWIWFRQFLKCALIKTEYFFKRANEIEIKLELETDIIPDGKATTDTLDEKIYSKSVIDKLNRVKSITFPALMVNCSYLVWTIWGVLIFEFLIRSFFHFFSYIQFFLIKIMIT